MHANETVRFDPGDSTRYFLAQGIDPDSWDQWNTDRDQAMNQMAAQETREAIGSGNAGAAGVSDLDYYGNWYSSNGTSFWVPDGAGAGWDPYGSGYWGNYGGSAGYVWISGYPWGWLPYHCGTWNYFNSFNQWGWIPGGSCWNGGGITGIRREASGTCRRGITGCRARLRSPIRCRLAAVASGEGADVDCGGSRTGSDYADAACRGGAENHRSE